MKILEHKQRSAAWYDARLGKPTASHFGEIITPQGAVRKGAQPRRYLLELLGERLTRLPTQHFETAAMQRGVDLEPKARDWYAFTTGQAVRECGLVLSDCERFGGSPDGLCEGRGIEIKCLMQAGFLDVAESGKLPDEHLLQVQGMLWLTKFAAWDYVLFTDVVGLVPQIYEVKPIAEIQEAFDQYLPAFADKLDEVEKKMRDAGHGWKVEQSKELSWDDIVDGVTIP